MKCTLDKLAFYSYLLLSPVSACAVGHKWKEVPSPTCGQVAELAIMGAEYVERDKH